METQLVSNCSSYFFLAVIYSDVNKTKFLRPRPKLQDQDRRLQYQDQSNKTKTIGSKQRHLTDLTFK